MRLIANLLIDSEMRVNWDHAVHQYHIISLNIKHLAQWEGAGRRWEGELGPGPTVRRQQAITYKDGSSY